MYHPFYPYDKTTNSAITDGGDMIQKVSEVISICRVDYNKNIDIILKANKKLERAIQIYGILNPAYLSTLHLDDLGFYKYYNGTFEKSFSQVSNLLHNAKFVIDLSAIPNDGGGTQYTFLEAIYNNCAIILNRKWIEGVDKKYRDFEEGYNCYAVSDEQELIDLLHNSKNIDTAKIIENANKLLNRHTDAVQDWNKIIFSN